MIDAIDLDHVAVAAECQPDVWPRYAGDLAGEWLAGGDAPGFSSAQVRYANGMRLEVLEPHDIEVNDFLRRFLDASGPGPHHLTFKVPDLGPALAEVEAAGIDPVGVDRSEPSWQEAFLHPKSAFGVVVQLASSDGTDEWETPRPAAMPQPRRDTPASLDRVVHAVASLADALPLFEGVLGGQPGDAGEDADSRYVELTWPGPGRIRLVEPTGPDSPTARHLAGRSGRVYALAFSVEGPGLLAGATPLSDGRWTIAPEDNLGVRLLLTPRS